MNFNSILLGSEDPKPLVAYYTKLFGKPTWEDESYTGWLIGSGAFSIGPHSEVKGKNTQPGRLIWNIETPEVKKEFDRFVAAGATVVAEPYTLGEGDFEGTICTFSDPDGNYFQLMTPMPEEMPS
jgi:predicted enzyme related to lactoylglutathione lyase